MIATLLAYRRSPMQSGILEWLRPKYWEISKFTLVLYTSLAALVWARRRARVSDWITYLFFAAAALSAVRNVILADIIGLMALASYLPLIELPLIDLALIDLALIDLPLIDLPLIDLASIDLAGYFRWKRALPAAAGCATVLLLGAHLCGRGRIFAGTSHYGASL